jgi:hypothetical protein
MRVLKFSKLFSIGLLLFSLTASASPLNRHRYHTSLTRIDYNEKDKILEISIELFTHDLAPMLEKKLKKQVDLEKSSETDKILFAYLNEKFVLKNKQNNVKKMNWVGKEVETDTVNVYLEIPSEENLENLSLQNSIFFESFPEQTNLVVARQLEKKYDLLFRVGDEFKPFKKLN